MTTPALALPVQPVADELPPSGIFRVQPTGHTDVFKPPHEQPLSDLQRWIRERRLRYARWEKPGDRFRDPNGQYKETYGGTRIADCIVEVLQRYAPDATTFGAALRIRRSAAPHPFRPGTVPSTELAGKAVWLITETDDNAFVDVRHGRTHTWLSLSATLSNLTRRSMFQSSRVDSAVLTSPGVQARLICQAVSRFVFEDPGNWSGIAYSSRLGFRHDNWMLYDRAAISATLIAALNPYDVEVATAAQELGIEVV